MQNKLSLAWRDQKTAVTEAPLKIGNREYVFRRNSQRSRGSEERPEEHQRLLGDARPLRTLGLVITHKAA